MRLHRLTVSAFGPFPREVVVDFDEVCAAGLFLIHGATGAGKTSLLDAICFALFADVPGGRTRRGLASDHAVAGARPVIILEFSVATRRFRLERSPEFSRPKRRGEGVTRVQASVTLEERTDIGWRALSTRHDEVAELIRDVLGMGLAQFAKVVVLPQGDVSAFLRASPEDRRALLERLFDISTFTRVEDWLVEERRRTAAVGEQLNTAVTRELARLHDRLSSSDAPDWQSIPVEAIPTALDAHLAEGETEVVGLLAAVEESATTLALATAALHEARAAVTVRERGLRARTAHDAALAQAVEVSAWRVSLAQAADADALTGHLTALEDALADEERAHTQMCDAFGLAGLDPADSVRALKRAAALAEAVRSTDQVVSDLAHAAGELTRAQRTLTEAEEALLTAQTAMARTEEVVQQVRTVLSTATDRHRELDRLAALLPSARTQHSALVKAVATVTEIADLTDQSHTCAPALIRARDTVLVAQRAVIDLRQRRLDGMAAELATSLCEGDACPVCGSVDHPARAVRADAVTAEDVTRAEATLTAAHDALGILERDATARASRIEALQDQLGAGTVPDLTALVRQRDAAAQSLQESTAAARDLVAAAEAVAEATFGLKAATETSVDAGELLSAARATVRSAAASRDRHAAAVDDLHAKHAPCPCTDDSGREITSILTCHPLLRQILEEVASAGTRHTNAVTRRRQCAKAASRAATGRGFESLDAARSALLDPRTLDELRSRIAEHEQRLAVAAAVLAEDDVRAALERPPPDLETASRIEAEARSTARQVQVAHTAAEGRLMVLRSVAVPVRELVDELIPARARAAAVKEVADTVSGVGGDNLYRMRLSSFVLAARLEKVVDLANERLHRMDAGRYLLEHSDARAAGGARSGLDLRVLDQWTGRTRETASLSGGESFMVSLALALALADAVREEAGGFDLETLFVDEGFGSLDETSLEHVLGVLDDLREGGRAVGVVSHVADLRSRITHQVFVAKSATGSDVTVRTVA